MGADDRRAGDAPRRAYRGEVLMLLAEHGTVDETTLAAWRDAQLARGLSRSTVRQRIAAARAFAGWAARVGVLDPAQAVRLSVVQAPTVRGDHGPRALTDVQVRRMDEIAGAVWPDDPLRVVQARALLRVLSSCGPRVAELHAARLAALGPARPTAADRAQLHGHDMAGYSLRIEGKGSRRRSLPVPATARKAIHALHDQLGSRHTAGAALIPALSSHRPARLADPRCAMSTRTMQQAVARLADAVNEHAGRAVIDAAAAHPHALRHGFALRYLRDHPDSLGRLRVLLGHADVATTARYLASLDTDHAAPPHDPWAH